MKLVLQLTLVTLFPQQHFALLFFVELLFKELFSDLTLTLLLQKLSFELLLARLLLLMSLVLLLQYLFA